MKYFFTDLPWVNLLVSCLSSVGDSVTLFSPPERWGIRGQIVNISLSKPHAANRGSLNLSPCSDWILDFWKVQSEENEVGNEVRGGCFQPFWASLLLPFLRFGFLLSSLGNDGVKLIPTQFVQCSPFPAFRLEKYTPECVTYVAGVNCIITGVNCIIGQLFPVSRILSG